MKELDPKTVESSELVDQAFDFWFNDHEHIRSPFPVYIQPELRILATQRFYEWASGLNKKAKDEVNDQIIAEKFEEIIFETATGLVKTEDEKITITYPFLPRIGDTIYEDVEKQTGESTVIDRDIVKEGDNKYLLLKLQNVHISKFWETKFELPL